MNVVVSTPDAIVTAAQALEAGRLVAFPTETVYGLGPMPKTRLQSLIFIKPRDVHRIIL
jgi:tRNA A37 threonylcarbamoyladenosine synthetase subunit TsaC/SUA5/YrdC